MSKEIKLQLFVDNGHALYDTEIFYNVPYEIFWNDFTPTEFVEFYERLSEKVNAKINSVSVSFDEIANAIDMGYVEYNENEELVILNDNYNYIKTLNYNKNDYLKAREEIEKEELKEMYEDYHNSLN